MKRIALLTAALFAGAAAMTAHAQPSAEAQTRHAL